MEDYGNSYAQMVDEQLLSLAAEPDSLIEAAHNALFEELSRRGLGENEIRAWQDSYRKEWRSRFSRRKSRGGFFRFLGRPYHGGGGGDGGCGGE